LGREVPVLVHNPDFGDIDSGLQENHDVCTILVDFLKVQGGCFKCSMRRRASLTSLDVSTRR
jgi:hypothetical protein